MKSFGACSAIVMAPGCLQFLLVGVLSVGPAVGASPLGAQSVQPAPSGAWTVEFSESPGGESPTFRSDPQPVTVREAMGGVLVTAEPFRLLTDLTESRLAGCQSTRPDLPDARIQPTTNGAEYAITMDGTKSGTVQVSRASPGSSSCQRPGRP